MQDHYTGQDFGQGEVRQGFATDGEYQVVLPDGRKQIVTYKVADQSSGYVADVRYEGEAKYEAIAPYRAPYAAPYASPAPYVAPIVTPAPYVAPVVTPAPYVAPVQPYAYAQAPYRSYAPAQPYQVPSAARKYNFQPVAEAVAPIAAPVEVPIAEERVAAASAEEVGLEDDNPVRIFSGNSLPAEFDSLFYEDAQKLKPQRKEKVHNIY